MNRFLLPSFLLCCLPALAEEPTPGTYRLAGSGATVELTIASDMSVTRVATLRNPQNERREWSSVATHVSGNRLFAFYVVERASSKGLVGSLGSGPGAAPAAPADVFTGTYVFDRNEVSEVVSGTTWVRDGDRYRAVQRTYRAASTPALNQLRAQIVGTTIGETSAGIAGQALIFLEASDGRPIVLVDDLDAPVDTIAASFHQGNSVSVSRASLRPVQDAALLADLQSKAPNGVYYQLRGDLNETPQLLGEGWRKLADSINAFEDDALDHRVFLFQIAQRPAAELQQEEIADAKDECADPPPTTVKLVTFDAVTFVGQRLPGIVRGFERAVGGAGGDRYRHSVQEMSALLAAVSSHASSITLVESKGDCAGIWHHEHFSLETPFGVFSTSLGKAK